MRGRGTRGQEGGIFKDLRTTHSLCSAMPYLGLESFQTLLFNACLTTGGRASVVAQMVKSLPAVQEIRVRSLGWEDPLEKGMATHSRILAWKIPRTEEPGRLPSMGLQRVRHD